MARKRVTKEEKAQRQQWAVAQIDKGVGFLELTSLTSETWGVTRRQARTVVKEAHEEWLDAFNDEDITYASSCDRSAAQPNPPKNRNVGTKVGQTAG